MSNFKIITENGFINMTIILYMPGGVWGGNSEITGDNIACSCYSEIKCQDQKLLPYYYFNRILLLSPHEGLSISSRIVKKAFLMKSYLNFYLHITCNFKRNLFKFFSLK